MELIHLLSGGASVVKKYQADATLSAAGAALRGSNDAGIGSVRILANGAAGGHGMVGCSTDTTGTVSATADEVDTLVSVIINPDAVWEAKMTNGATEDTALALLTPGSASATGITIDAVTIDDSGVFGYSGSNAGSLRRADDAIGGVALSFDRAVAVADRYFVFAAYPGAFRTTSEPIFFHVSTLATQIDATVTSTDEDNFRCVDVSAKDLSDDGINSSFYHLVANAHMVGGNLT